MAELLLEFFSEEIPARMQASGAENLGRLLAKVLEEARLTHGAMRTFATPRRLVVHVDDLPTAQPDQRTERKGPRTDAPEQAIQGFLRSTGLTIEQCAARETPKGTFYFAVIEAAGQPTAAVLPDVIAAVADQMPWPKSMRWGDGSFRWVRPLQGVLAVFDGKPLSGSVAGVPFGGTTVGHRFLAPKPFNVTTFAQYHDTLRNAFVVLDAAERQQLIWDDAVHRAAQDGLAVREDAALLAEVAGLVEWPVVLMGEIDTAFMAVPPEVLHTAMRTHQKYFSVLNADGTPAPRFICVANMLAEDGGKTILAGNERVLRARLSDAKFFWDLDRKTRLEEHVPALEHIVFHAKLGSLGEKAARMQALAGELAPYIPGCDRDLARSAAMLAKADLVTEMVGEFPELQGIMGRYYALEQGERAEVAAAIGEHYAPAGPGDTCPTAPISVAVALADKIDTLAGFWAIDQKPTGSKDPFALRRAALGIIRIVLENDLRLSLDRVFETATGLYSFDEPADTAVVRDLISFLADRLKVHLREEGVPHEHVAAVFALGGEDDLVRLQARVRALGAFLNSDDGGNLLTAYRRAANIVRVEEKRDGATFDGGGYVADLAAGDEAKLWTVLEEIERGLGPRLAGEQFSDAMTLLAMLRRPVDDFFDNVTVNVDDTQIRGNRLRLLARIGATMNRIADFSQIPG